MPSRITVIEWIRCLISPQYAANTHLRITEEEEQRAFIVINMIIAVLIVLCVRQGYIVANRLYTNHKIYQINEYNKTHPIHIKEFKVI